MFVAEAADVVEGKMEVTNEGFVIDEMTDLYQRVTIKNLSDMLQEGRAFMSHTK